MVQRNAGYSTMCVEFLTSTNSFNKMNLSLCPCASSPYAVRCAWVHPVPPWCLCCLASCLCCRASCPCASNHYALPPRPVLPQASSPCALCRALRLALCLCIMLSAWDVADGHGQVYCAEGHWFMAKCCIVPVHCGCASCPFPLQ